jgi:hypothetical protein
MMKNKFALWGLLGFLGLGGLLLNSPPLSGLALLFLLFLTAPVNPGEAFNALVARSGKRAFISGACVSGAFYLLAALLIRHPQIGVLSFQFELLLLVSAIMIAYICGIAVFVGCLLWGCLFLGKKTGR